MVRCLDVVDNRSLGRYSTPSAHLELWEVVQMVVVIDEGGGGEKIRTDKNIFITYHTVSVISFKLLIYKKKE